MAIRAPAAAFCLHTLFAQDIFTVNDIAWRGREHGSIKLVACRDDVLYVATERGKVLRWQPATKELLDLEVTKRTDDCIHGIHLDPAGRHMVVAFSHGETVYMSLALPKPKLLTSLKGTLVESVAFESDAHDGSSARPLDFLLGTGAGTIMKMTLEGGKEKNCRQIWSASDSSAPICCIQIETVHVKSGGGESARLFVMAASPSRYYQFIGGPTIDALFAAHSRTSPQFIELPGDLSYVAPFPLCIFVTLCAATRSCCSTARLAAARSPSSGSPPPAYTVVPSPSVPPTRAPSSTSSCYPTLQLKMRSGVTCRSRLPPTAWA